MLPILSDPVRCLEEGAVLSGSRVQPRLWCQRASPGAMWRLIPPRESDFFMLRASAVSQARHPPHLGLRVCPGGPGSGPSSCPRGHPCGERDAKQEAGSGVRGEGKWSPDSARGQEPLSWPPPRGSGAPLVLLMAKEACSAHYALK